jgi:hypothetical protein
MAVPAAIAAAGGFGLNRVSGSARRWFGIPTLHWLA